MAATRSGARSPRIDFFAGFFCECLVFCMADIFWKIRAFSGLRIETWGNRRVSAYSEQSSLS